MMILARARSPAVTFNAMQQESGLQIDRSLQNDRFQSWRLSGPGFLQSRSHWPLARPLAQASLGDVNDYISTRAAVLHNHLHQTQPDAERLFVFVRDPHATATTLCQVLPAPNSTPPFFMLNVAGQWGLVAHVWP